MTLLSSRPYRSSRRPLVARPARPATALESLESRLLFHLEVIDPLDNTFVAPGDPATGINLNASFDNENATGSIVRLATTAGDVFINMLDSQAPISVNNFLGYVNRGEYNGVVFHRLVPGFVIQGGGYLPNGTDITPPPPPGQPDPRAIQNEFSPDRSNVAGTVAYAKLGGDPNSATSEFFFNLDDNSQNLDFQNGGFTVFARVINQTILTNLNQLNTTDASELNSAFSDLPVLQEVPDPATPAPGDFVTINTASVVPEITYSVSSSNPGLVNPTLSGNNLVLNYPQGAAGTGSATVTVTATDFTGAVLQQTFEAAVGELPVTIGTGGARAVTFTDPDGTVATVTVKNATATARFVGNDLSRTAGRSADTVGGTNVTAAGLNITGASSRTTVTVKARGGNGRITLGGLTSDGSLKSISGSKTLSLAGVTSVNGDVASLSAFGTEAGSSINANSIRKISLAGDAAGNLVLTSGSSTALGSASVKGNVTGGQWNVSGGSGKVSVNSTSLGWTGVFGGDVRSFAAKGNMGGNLTANSVRSMTVGGDLTGDVGLTAPFSSNSRDLALGKLTVKLATSGVNIITNGSIGSITTGTIADSNVYAGVVGADGLPFPDSLDDFVAGSDPIINTFTVKSRGQASFADTNIAARRIGKLTLSNLQLSNGAVPFGVAADRITSVTITVDGDKTTLKNLDDPADAATQIAGLGVNLQDFQLRVL